MEEIDIKKCLVSVVSADSYAELERQMLTCFHNMVEGIKLLDWKFSSHSYTDAMGKYGERFTIVMLHTKAPEKFEQGPPIQSLTFQNR